MRFPYFLTKWLSTALSLVFLVFNCALANVPEANFWAERRKHVKAQKKKSDDSLLLARLPTATIPPLAESLSKSLIKDLPAGSTKKYAPVLKALPYQYGIVRQISIPPNQKMGEEKMVIHIQDIHLNSEAQFLSANLSASILSTFFFSSSNLFLSANLSDSILS